MLNVTVSLMWLPNVPSFECIFVGGVPRSTTADGLREAFAREGSDVGWIDLVKDPSTGQNRGFAFVELLSRFDASVDPRALDALAAASIDGRSLDIKGVPRRRRRHAL